MSNKEKCCCFGDILRIIDILQRNAEKIEDIDDSCAKPFLGNCSNCICFNTRPVTFYTCNNELLRIEFQEKKDGKTITRSSSVFRVEKVEDCCVTVSILEANPVTTDPNRPYVSTGQFATINLNCVCVLQCLRDTVIDCL